MNWKLYKRGITSGSSPEVYCRVETKPTDVHRSKDPLLPFTAYATRSSGLRIEPAGANRAWMDETMLRFANRCLPLRIANEAGWFILNDRTLHVTWHGGIGVSDTTISYDTAAHTGFHSNDSEHPAKSHFGYGIVTWQIPYVFRTSVGYDLFVRGPANWCKDGACPLEGIVETEWAVSTFTMNWKITRTGHPVTFFENEPICMLLPIPRKLGNRFLPQIRDIDDEPALAKEYSEWKYRRNAFIQNVAQCQTTNAWQKHYYAGTKADGSTFEDHQTKVAIRPFDDLRRRK